MLNKESILLDKKGIFSFLAITFGITYLVEFIMILMGVRFSLMDTIFAAQITVAALMWVPALATFITVRFVTKEKFSTTLLRFGSWKPYLATWLLIPLAFVLVYGLTWGLGLAQPDWQISSLWKMMVDSGADMTGVPAPETMVQMLFAISLFGAPWFNSLLGFGEEWGWRGYLLPRLMPLGKVKAYLLTGVIWGLWHAPLVAVGFGYPGQSPLIAVLLFIAMTTALSIFMNELTLRYRSSILAGWIHGIFNAQAYGIWRIVFTGYNPLIGGFSGIIGIAVLTLIGLGTVWFFNRKPAVQPGLAAQV